MDLYQYVLEFQLKIILLFLDFPAFLDKAPNVQGAANEKEDEGVVDYRSKSFGAAVGGYILRSLLLYNGPNCLANTFYYFPSRKTNLFVVSMLRELEAIMNRAKCVRD